jgi:hypothetical protein
MCHHTQLDYTTPDTCMHSFNTFTDSMCQVPIVYWNTLRNKWSKEISRLLRDWQNVLGCPVVPWGSSEPRAHEEQSAFGGRTAGMLLSNPLLALPITPKYSFPHGLNSSSILKICEIVIITVSQFWETKTEQTTIVFPHFRKAGA